MSRWEDTFKEHAIHQTLLELRECLDTEIDEPSASITSEKRRLIKVLDTIYEFLSSVDPELVPDIILDQVNNLLHEYNFQEHVQYYKNDPELSYLNDANDEIDSQLPEIYKLFGLRTDERAIKLNKSTEKSFYDFSKTIEAKSGKFATEIETFKSQISQIEEKKTALNTKIEELNTEMEVLNGNQKNKIAEWDSNFADSEDVRSKEFRDSQVLITKTFETWFKETMESREKNLEEFFDKFKTEIENKQIDAEKRHDEILKLHGLVAGDGVVAGFVNNAEEEKKLAHLWSFSTIAIILSTAAWLFWSNKTGSNLDLDASSVLARTARDFPLTLVLLSGATYSARQSKLHRDNEKQTRWFALEVKAIDPFIASLEPNKQQELKEKLTERIFGQSHGSQVSDAANVDPNIMKILHDIIKTVMNGK